MTVAYIHNVQSAENLYHRNPFVLEGFTLNIPVNAWKLLNTHAPSFPLIYRSVELCHVC